MHAHRNEAALFGNASCNVILSLQSFDSLDQSMDVNIVLYNT